MSSNEFIKKIEKITELRARVKYIEKQKGDVIDACQLTPWLEE